MGVGIGERWGAGLALAWGYVTKWPGIVQKPSSVPGRAVGPCQAGWRLAAWWTSKPGAEVVQLGAGLDGCRS